MEILIVHWEMMVKLILVIAVTSHVLTTLEWLVVLAEHAKLMGPGLALKHHVKQVC